MCITEDFIEDSKGPNDKIIGDSPSHECTNFTQKRTQFFAANF
jgi:hypothetical protein